MIASGALASMHTDFSEPCWLESHTFSPPETLANFVGWQGGSLYIRGGVYALFYRHPNGFLDLRYIGQSPPRTLPFGFSRRKSADEASIRPDFSHPAVRKILEDTGCIRERVYVAWHTEPDAQQRAQIRRHLIAMRHPVYNHPPSRVHAVIASLLSLGQHQPACPCIL